MSWIVVFDLDDTLVTRDKGGPVVLYDTLSFLAKAIDKRSEGKVQYIYLYTYNRSETYIREAIEAIKYSLLTDHGIRVEGESGPFDDLILVKTHEEAYTSKSMARIQETYDMKHQHTDITGRIIFLDDIIHETLFNEIGSFRYCHLGNLHDPLAVLHRALKIREISMLLDNDMVGGRRRRMTKRRHKKRRSTKN